MENRTNYFVLAHIGSSQQKTFKIRAIDKADVVFKMWANHKISEVSIKNNNYYEVDEKPRVEKKSSRRNLKRFF